MAKTPAKFKVPELDSADIKLIQNEIVHRLALKKGTNFSPHDSHSSSHSKNSVTLKGSRLAKGLPSKKVGG